MKSLIAVVLATLACEALRHFLAPTNMVMFYLLAVVMAALRLGRKPAILTAFLSVLAFDFFFVPPRLTLVVSNTEYLITFVALFSVGVIISTLVAKSRERADALREREVQTASLYYLSRDLAVAGGIEAIMEAVVRNVGESLHCKVAILLPEGERLEIKAGSTGLNLDLKEQAVADWAFRNRQPAGRGTDTLGSSALLYLPLQGSASLLGVLGVKLENEAEYRSPQIRRLLDAFASQAAMAMERVQLGKQAAQAQILQARETLERALLNSVSHDLRTPLASITGVLSSLKDEGEHLNAAVRRELLETASEEAGRLNRFVGNLLDMTRLEAGKLALKKEPCDVQDLIGCALAALEPRSQQPRGVGQDTPGDAAGPHGSGADDPGAGESPGQRSEIFTSRHPGGDHRPDRRPLARHRDRGPGARGPRPRPETDLRQVLPYPGTGRGRRDRPGAFHLQGDRGGPRRRHPGGEPAGRRAAGHGETAAGMTCLPAENKE